MDEVLSEQGARWLQRVNTGLREVSVDRRVVALSALMALAIFLTTLQLDINGTEHRYATDVGEIQNALPRWGTIHFTGYPQFTALGSIFVNAVRLVGIAPAAAGSLYSALWGAVAAGILTALVLSFGVPAFAALLASLLFTLSTSLWVFGSIAELHTMTMALTFATLLMGVRFGRRGRPSDLYWLVFLSSQGITHQRAFGFLAPALALLIIRHWRVVLKKWLPVAALALSGPVTYLYLPLVARLGSDWVFSDPGTWQGFWALFTDTKTERIISVPGSLVEALERLRAVVNLLNDDLPAPVWIAGLLGLTFAWRDIDLRERGALTLTWMAYVALSLIISVGFIGEAVLAAKLPVIAMAAVGIAYVAADVARRSRTLKAIAALSAAALVVFLFVTQRPTVVEITRDDNAAQTIATVQSIPPAGDGRPITMMALWGNDYWQLAYAQAYKGLFPRINLVGHDTNFSRILARGDHLYTLSRTFLTRPLQTWKEQLGSVQLASVVPGIIEIRQKSTSETIGGDTFDLGNGIAIQDATLSWWDEQTLLLTVQWHAHMTVQHDFSVAVHLVSVDPPTGPQDLLAQADSLHPVEGYYPTSLWEQGERIPDHYLLEVPPGTAPVAVRVGMYRQLSDGQFQNTEILSLPLPAKE